MTKEKAKSPEAIFQEYLFNTSSGDKWKRIGTKKRSGFVVPLFSVYSRGSVGIGDFSDLKLLIDWCSDTGNSVIELLPMNEMGVLFCPYDSESSFALEPAYICLQEIIPKENKILLEKAEKLKKILPAGSAHIDYTIKKEKMQLLWEIYQQHSDTEAATRKFDDENTYWLEDFALFKVLKEYYEGLPWYEWKDLYKNHDAKALDSFRKEHKKKIAFHVWVQWLLYRQFKDAKAYAESKNVLIKGDLPIFVSRDSADVWAYPEFFKLEFAAGAPPDMYCAKGQRWGMPTYNWEKIALDEYKYLKAKLKYADNFYDLLRIDHVVGLFRVWSIPHNEPMENQGLNGSFDPWDERLWAWHGRNLLTVMLDNTKTLLCAEDLGVIPQVCTDTIRELGIPGNEVQRWVKDWDVRRDFLPPEEYRELSVSMLSTHDTTNWPAWWENEAGTVDEALFIRMCNERSVDFVRIKEKLFDAKLSRHGRLRWSNKVNSIEKLAALLGKTPQELGDFIRMYENTFQEKEKLWKHLGLKGKMREKTDSEIIHAALNIALSSNSIFCINLITDVLYLGNILKGDPYQYRFNTPGTISEKNWSLTIPISLEELLKHKVNKDIRKSVESSGRI